MAEILFEKELIRNVASDLGMEEKKIEHHLSFLKHFLSSVVNSDDIHSLQIPHVGVMYRNIKGCAHMNTYIERMGLGEKYQKRIDKNEQDIKNILTELKSFDNISLHNTKRRIHNPFFTCTKNKKELEKFQNNGG